MKEIGRLSEEELMSYEANLKYKHDAESVFNSARNASRVEGYTEGYTEGYAEGYTEGLAVGKREGTIAIALKLKKMRLPIADITKVTGLSVEELEKL